MDCSNNILVTIKCKRSCTLSNMQKLSNLSSTWCLSLLLLLLFLPPPFHVLISLVMQVKIAMCKENTSLNLFVSKHLEGYIYEVHDWTWSTICSLPNGLHWTSLCLMKIMHMMKPCIDKVGSVQHKWLLRNWYISWINNIYGNCVYKKNNLTIQKIRLISNCVKKRKRKMYNIWNLLGMMYACFNLWPTKDILNKE